MPKMNADEVALKLRKLLDELSLLKVHSVVLASFINEQENLVFGIDTNTSHNVAISLLNAATKAKDLGVSEPGEIE